MRRNPRHQELRLLGGGSLRSAPVWGTTAEVEMKALRLAAGFALILGLAGCGESDEGAQSATVMPEVVGQQLDAALTAIEDAGFEDDVDVGGGGMFGVVDESNWTVCDQTPAAGASITDAPQLAVDRSCDAGGGAEPEEATEPAETAESPADNSAPPANEVLTAANNTELAAILVETDYCSDSIGAFATTHRGRTIEFDGNIAAMGPHGDYDTRYDILLAPGDYSETTGIGPAFQFRDVGIVDLNLTGPNIPEAIGQGDNIHIVAEVMEFDAGGCLFLIDPVSTAMR